MHFSLRDIFFFVLIIFQKISHSIKQESGTSYTKYKKVCVRERMNESGAFSFQTLFK